MTNVVDMPGASFGYAARADEAPVPLVVERLEKMLALAREGKIRSFAATIVEGPSVTSSVWAASDGWYQELLAGIAHLQFRFLMDNSGHGIT